MRGVAAVTLVMLLALVAGAGCKQPTAKVPSSAAYAAPVAKAPAGPRTLQVPAQFRGKLVSKRIRHFPKKLLALTFDDGPNPQITPAVLKTLKQYQAHATFFVLGSCAQTYPALVKQAAAEGHAIGSHSWSHPSSTTPEKAASELAKTATIIEKLTGRKPQLFRPPYGITKGNLCQLALRQGYPAILWTISSADSNPIGPSVIARNVIHTPNPGEIILMHDGAGHKATAAALPQVLKELTAAGFTFVTVPKLMQEWVRWQQAQTPVKTSAPR